MFFERQNFLSDETFQVLIDHSRTAEFKDTENDRDGVTYPNISADIPEAVVNEITAFFGKEPKHIFMRRSPEGVEAPQAVHADDCMGNLTLILYLNDFDGGTSFMHHGETGVAYAPIRRDLIDLCIEDQNNLSAWIQNGFCKAEPNKACIFNAHVFHCAMPVGGCGQGTEARTILGAFFE